MAEPLWKNIDDAVTGVKDFLERFGRTWLLLLALRTATFREYLAGGDRDRVLPPDAFLLSAAVTLGFLGETLDRGLENLDLGVVDALGELTVWSFLSRSVTLFVVALIVGGAFAGLLRSAGSAAAAPVRHFVHYVVGYFALAAIAWLILVSVPVLALLRLSTPDAAAWAPGVGWLLLGVFVLHAFWLLLAGCRRLVEEPLARRLFMRIGLAVLSAAGIALCVVGLFLPVGGGARLEGSLVHLELAESGPLQLTYTLANRTGAPLVVSFVGHEFLLETTGEAAGGAAQARSVPGGGASPGAPPIHEDAGWLTSDCRADSVAAIHLLAAGETSLFTSYLCGTKALAFARRHYTQLARVDGTRLRLEPRGSVEIDVRIVAGASDERTRVTLH